MRVTCPLIAMISGPLHPASASRRHAALRSPCGLQRCGKPAASHQLRNCSLNALGPYGRPVAVIRNVSCSLGVAASTACRCGCTGIANVAVATDALTLHTQRERRRTLDWAPGWGPGHRLSRPYPSFYMISTEEIFLPPKARGDLVRGAASARALQDDLAPKFAGWWWSTSLLA